MKKQKDITFTDNDVLSPAHKRLLGIRDDSLGRG
jgi:hypothetical protein